MMKFIWSLDPLDLFLAVAIPLFSATLFFGWKDIRRYMRGE